MVKKILLGFVGLVITIALASGAYWWANGDRLRAEYAAYKKTGAPVLMYHGVGVGDPMEWLPGLLVSPDQFEAQVKYLKDNGYTMVTVAELAERLEKGLSVDKYVAFSFDDGYENNLTIAIPIMQKYGAKGSFFVINQKLGKKDYMNDAQLKQLLAAGMELGSHGYSHSPLGNTPEKYLVWEMDTARYWLKKKTDGYIVRTLAYPNGSYNERVIAAAKKWGFYRALTGHIGLNTAETFKKAPMEMYRVTVADDGKGLAGFEKRLEQAYLFGFLQTKGIDINIVRDIFVKDI